MWQQVQAATVNIFPVLDFNLLQLICCIFYLLDKLHHFDFRRNDSDLKFKITKFTKSKTPFADFIYRVNGRQWEQKIMNTDNSLVVGDTIKILCSKNDPEIFEQLSQ